MVESESTPPDGGSLSRPGSGWKPASAANVSTRCSVHPSGRVTNPSGRVTNSSGRVTNSSGRVTNSSGRVTRRAVSQPA